MLKTASKPVDVQDLQFKLQCRLNIFDKHEGSVAKTTKSLLASASRYGLVFVGCLTAKLKVLSFESIESNSSSEATKDYSRREINLISEPYYICVNCDHTILAVVVQKDGCLSALFYDVLSFYKENVVLLNEIRLTSTPGLDILQTNWHPTINNIFTECKSDGTLGIYELKDKTFDVKKLPAESKACCFCWSPKGKQIAVGSQNGTIIHYKPDLKAVKSIDAPPLNKPQSMLSLQWISNYQFVGIFKTSQESDPEYSVVLIDAPKTGSATFTNFYDICYSNGNLRPPQFYMISELHWNILLVASANSMEVGVLTNTGEIWTQCILPDSARAELPLDENQDETFPIGMTIDTSSDKPVLWGESYLQPAPSLILLSHQGVLCCFKMINLKEGAPSVNSPAEKVGDLSGLRHFVTPVPEAVQITSSQEVTNVADATVAENQLNAASTPTAPLAQPMRSSTPITAPAVPSAQVQQTPTTPVSIFKVPPPKQQFPSVPTNLFGVSIERKETPASATASLGASLLSNILSEGGPAQRNENATPPGRPFSNNTLSGPVAAQTNSSALGSKQGGVTAMPSAVSAASAASNRFSGSSQVQTANYPLTSVPSQNTHFGLQRTDIKPNVFPSASNTTNPQEPAKIEKNSEERETADINRMLTKMVQMERAVLDKEIKDLIFQGQHLKIPLKSDQIDQIGQNTEHLKAFLKELVETCEVQSSEIHILKQNTIQSWAWVEEARSKLKESQDEELRSLMKSKPLDSVSEKHLSTLKQMRYYLSSQLTQSHKALDDQWDRFQDYCRKNTRLQLPTMEAIFQTMVKQNAVLQKHNYILQDIASQVRGKQKASNHAALFNPLDKKDSLESSFHNLKLEPENIYHIYYQKVLNRVKSVPANKMNQLRRILHNREVPHVMAKSQLSTSALNLTLKSGQLSGCPKTPIGKTLEEHPQLYQSTPLNLMPELAKQISSTPLSAFVPTTNVTAKPQVTTRYATESQTTIPSLGSNFNRENVTFTNPPFSGDKQSAVPQCQNSLFNTPMMGSNERIGYNAFSNFGSNQEANQNTFWTNRNTMTGSGPPTNPQTQKFAVPEPPVSTPLAAQQFAPLNPNISSNSNTVASTNPQNAKSTNVYGPNSSANTSQTGAPIRIFSFVSSSSQSKQILSSSTVTSVSTGAVSCSASFVGGFSTPSLGSVVPSVGGTVPPSIFKSASNVVSGFGNTGPEGLFPPSGKLSFGANSPSNKDGVTTPTQSLLSGNSFQTAPISMFNTSAMNSGAVSVSSVSSKINTSETNSGNKSANSKPLPTSGATTNSVPTSAVSVFVIPSTGVPTTGTTIFGTSTASGGPTSTSNTSQFGIASSNSVQTPSLFSISSKKEAISTGEIPPSSKSIFGNAAMNTGEVSSSSKSIFSTPTTNTSTSNNGGMPTSSPSIFGGIGRSNEAGPTNVKSIFGASTTTTETVSTTSSSIFGASIPSTGTSSKTPPSIFGATITSTGTTSTTSSSIFGSSTPSTGTASKTPPSIFGASITSTGTTTTTSSSIFGTSITSTGTTTTTSSSIFGTSITNTGAASTTSSSVFGASIPNTGAASTSASPILGASITSSGTASKTPPSIFGASIISTGTTSTTSSIFGASVPSTGAVSTSSSSIFGASLSTGTVSTTSSSVFGSSITSTGTTSTTSSSVFGSSITSTGTTSTISSSIFGGSITITQITSTTSSSIFGASTPSTGTASKTPASKFGAFITSTGTTSTASSSSIFGASIPSTGTASKTSTSVFGVSITNTGTAATTSSSIFGGSATSGGALSLTTKSVFGNAAAGSGSTIQTSTAATNSQPSPFGASSFSASGATPTRSIFGNATSASSPFSNATGKSLFGSTTAAGSPFGTPVSTSPFVATPFASATSSDSVFGQATSTASPFSSGVSTLQSSFQGTPSTADSLFGAAAPPVCSPFGTQGFGAGFNTNTAAQSSPFGQVSTPSNVFGSSNTTSAPAFGTAPSTENSTSPFGQTSGGMFGSFASSSAKPAEGGSFGFGNLNVGTASQGPFSKPNEGKSPFGAPTFNPTTTGSLFGSSTFGANNGNSVFRPSAFGGNSAFSSTQQSGPFSGGSGSITQTGFGVQTPQKSPAFGATPTFGGTPAFGSAPTFGGAPAFGGTPSFGSPNKVFGSPNPASAGSAFGSTNTQQSSGFGSFGSQSSLGFGNVAQQPNPPGVSPTQGSGFGSFASQNAIGFGNLAQQTNNSGQNAPFSGTSSFSSWR